MNNETYGLTKGQHSPTHVSEYASHVEEPMDAALLGLSIPATTFVARAYSGWFEQLVRLTRMALEHARAKQGFAFLEVISPCVTYEDSYPNWEQALYDIEADASYDPEDRAGAFATATRLGAENRLPAGLIYRAPAKEALTEAPVPARATIDPADLRARYEAILDRYAVARTPG